MPKSQKEMNTELMLSIHHNLLTAKQAINNVIDKITDNHLKRELKAQFKDYDGLSETCEDLARVYEIELTDNPFYKKARMWMSVNMAMLMDKSNTKIASINILGSTMGVLDLMKVIADSKKCKKEIVNLAKAVLSLEERNIEKLKPYILTESEYMRDKTEPSSENSQSNKNGKNSKKNNSLSKTKNNYNNSLQKTPTEKQLASNSLAESTNNLHDKTTEETSKYN